MTQGENTNLSIDSSSNLLSLKTNNSIFNLQWKENVGKSVEKLQLSLLQKRPHFTCRVTGSFSR